MSNASRVTIGDVADRAGVSIATVSRVVNGRYGVATSTHERVMKVIDDLGYEASLVARSLRSQRTNVIGILVADIEPFSAELLKGAAKALHGSDFELVVYAAGQHNNEGWERRYMSRLSGFGMPAGAAPISTISILPSGAGCDPKKRPSGEPKPIQPIAGCSRSSDRKRNSRFTSSSGGGVETLSQLSRRQLPDSARFAKAAPTLSITRTGRCGSSGQRG